MGLPPDFDSIYKVRRCYRTAKGYWQIEVSKAKARLTKLGPTRLLHSSRLPTLTTQRKAMEMELNRARLGKVETVIGSEPNKNAEMTRPLPRIWTISGKYQVRVE